MREREGGGREGGGRERERRAFTSKRCGKFFKLLLLSLLNSNLLYFIEELRMKLITLSQFPGSWAVMEYPSFRSAISPSHPPPINISKSKTISSLPLCPLFFWKKTKEKITHSQNRGFKFKNRQKVKNNKKEDRGRESNLKTHTWIRRNGNCGVYVFAICWCGSEGGGFRFFRSKECDFFECIRTVPGYFCIFFFFTFLENLKYLNSIE